MTLDKSTLSQLHMAINVKATQFDVNAEMSEDEISGYFAEKKICLNLKTNYNAFLVGYGDPTYAVFNDKGELLLNNSDFKSWKAFRIYLGSPFQDNYAWKNYDGSETYRYNGNHYRLTDEAPVVKDCYSTLITDKDGNYVKSVMWYKVNLEFWRVTNQNDYPSVAEWEDAIKDDIKPFKYEYKADTWIPTVIFANECDAAGLIKQTVEPFINHNIISAQIEVSNNITGHDYESNERAGTVGTNADPESVHEETPEVPSPEPEQEAVDNYSKNFESLFFETEKGYFTQLYSWKKDMYSAKSFDSIIGMPVQFMSNVDMRFGTSTFGKQFTEDILYDAPIAIIHPGAPALNASAFDVEDLGDKGIKGVIDTAMKAYVYAGAFINGEGETAVKNLLLNIMAGENTRFYGFQNEYNRYIQYVNTLCHLFASFLGIGDLINPRSGKLYREYDDSIEEVEKTDSGLGLKLLYGNYPAMFVYYQPDSSISHTVSNQTQESSLVSKLNEVSNYSKEMSFFAGGLGIASGAGVTVGADADNNSLFNLSNTNFAFGNNLISRIFSRTAEGVGTIIAGNNLSLPEIYSNSDMSGSEYTLNIKLVNPYGTPEGAFLFQLRHLARLMSVSFPRQFGPNGYTSPFIIRAFSKGNFNIQLGIVESLTIRRAGSGGENQTVHDIPMELDVSLTIKDLYKQVALTNEYTNGMIDLVNTQQLQLLFNNTGLLDFVASYAGYNMNTPDTDTAIDLVFDFMKESIKNNFKDIVDFNGTINFKEWKFARWNRMIMDSFRNAVASRTSFLSG